MTRIRITVNDVVLGDIVVEQDDQLASLNRDRQRHAIDDLLAQATRKIRLAYEIEATP